MTSPQERLSDAVRRSQETVNATVRTWSDGMQKLVSTIDLRTTVPTIEDLVDRSYAFAVQVLAVQRDFTKSLLAYAAPAPQASRTTPAKKSSGSSSKKS